MNYEEFYLMREMRRLFSEHTFYSRLYITLSAHDLDTQHVISRLYDNTQDITNIFNNYYSNKDSQQVYLLLRDHVSIECTIVDMMLKNNNNNDKTLFNNNNDKTLFNNIFSQSETNTFRQLETNIKDIISEKEKLYNNAILLAIHLESINPLLYIKTTKELIFEHLDLTEREIISMVSLDYKEDIKSADTAFYQSLEIADMLSVSIVKQFKRRFDNKKFNKLLPI